MKKFFKLVSILMVLLMALSMMAACGSKEEATTEESKEETTEEDALGAPEVTTVKWNSGTSKNVLITIANEKGYFEDEGITIEEVPADENNSAMACLLQVRSMSFPTPEHPIRSIRSHRALT